MLKKFRVNNFRNLINVEFQPTGLNLLVGPNNAGKTNLSAAIWFLGLSARFPLKDALIIALSDSFNITNAYIADTSFSIEAEVTLNDGAEELHFDYSLVVQVSSQQIAGPISQPVSLVEEKLRLTGGGFSDAMLIDNNKGTVRLLHEKNYLSQQSGEVSVETQAPADATMLMRLFDLETNKRTNLFKQYLMGWAYYNLNTQSLRSPKGTIGSNFLLRNGSNLGAALHFLHNQHPRMERKLIEAVRSLEPKLDAFTFFTPDNENVYWFIEDKTGKRFGVNSISDGTLLFTAIAFVILTSQKTQASAPVIIIEEPENGLYVGYLKTLVDMIDTSGKMGQFIFTSHNPYFIDKFAEHLDGLFYMRPGMPSSTLLRPNQDIIKKLLEDMPLGEMHFRELIRP